MNAGRRLLGMMALLLFGLVGCGGGDPTLTASQEELALGQQLYEANCAACHGVEGEGQANWRSPDANGRYPAPPHDDTGHTWHHPDQLLHQIVTHGGQMENSGMPAFGEQLTAEEIDAILSYIKTFWTAEQRATQTEMTERAAQ